MVGELAMRLLQALVAFHAGDAAVPTERIESVACMAQNIWHEARGSTPEDMLAVAHVVLNRVESEEYPDDICKVIWQPKQFSWTKDGRSDRVRFANPRDRKIWEDIVMISVGAMSGELSDVTDGSTHYHNRRVAPSWADDFILVARFGDHLYYRDATRPSRRPEQPL